MPVYEFRCEKCDLLFETVMSMKEEHVADCPKCKSSETKRIFHAPAIKTLSASEMQQRLMGVPKERIERTKHLRDQQKKRKQSPRSVRERDSNELHM